MKIKCKRCGYEEETSLDLFVKIIGGAMPIGGYWAWVTYFFAGTGLAMPIVIAMITGGSAILIYKKEIVEWITERGYYCPKCSATSWEAKD